MTSDLICTDYGCPIKWMLGDIFIHDLIKKKISSGSGYITYPNFLPPTLDFFLQILKFEENSRTK